MAGVLPCEVEMLTGRKDTATCWPGVAGQPVPGRPAQWLRGHEFHHSQVIGADTLQRAYRLSQGKGGKQDGIVYKNVLAAYTHLHAYGSPGWAPGLVERIRAKSHG